MADGLFYVDSKVPHLAADVASVTLSTTLKALVPAGSLPPLGSNYFSFVGKAVRIKMTGRITTGATPGNGQFALMWGSGADNTGTNVVQSSTFALVASQTNLTWWLELILRCRAIGTSGSLIGTGIMSFNNAVVASTNQPILIPASAPAATTIDTTAANLLSPQFLRSGSTAETMQVHECLTEALN